MSTRSLSGRILLISDDLEANNIWAYLLSQRGLEVVTDGFGARVIEGFIKDPFDLIIINCYSVPAEALALCRRLRPEMLNPLLLMVATQEEGFLLDAYLVGVDDCIVKPIGHRLFVAKISAWLRRSWTIPTEALNPLQVEDLRLDPAQRQIIIGEKASIKLTNLEFRVLHLLMSRRGQVLETSLIVDRVWGHASDGDGVLLKNVVYRLRRKIESDPANPRYLQTRAGGGYIFHIP